MSLDQPAIPKSAFVHLHAHSMFSLYDAMGSVEDLVDRAKELGYDALALTDHNSLYGTIEFYEAAHKAGIKPIIGIEANIAVRQHTDRRPGIDTHSPHLTLLAETIEGYKNLLTLVSISYLDGFYYKPRMDKDLLRRYGKGIIALSGCGKGEIPKACQAHDTERARTLITEYQEIFGRDSFFLEMVHHPESPTQIDINESLVKLSAETGAPLVATKDVHYLNPSDREAQDVLMCIHDGKMVDDRNRFSMSLVDHALCGPEEMVLAFKDHPEAIANTRRIADRCTVALELGKNLLPKFQVPEDQTEISYLRTLCETGLLDRYPDTHQEGRIRDRLAFELATIERMGFAAYFLIVQDYIVWAKEHGVIVGPGRGSAAGSIVAYALHITNLDPLRYGLLFERFLNPDRISMPDIDIDFDDVKRKDVIEYVSGKYGKDRVAGIITFGTMAARAAIRDVGRVLGLPYGDVDRVAKVVPPPVQGKHIPLEQSIKDAPDLRAMYENDPRIKRLIDLAIKLEGTTRHASQHACGIVIAPEALSHFAPLQKAQGGDVEQVIQYSLHSSEACGLLKMDFLGLSNLSVIRDCLEMIRIIHKEEVDINTIPLDDARTFALLGNGDTTGVFQLESDGMKKYIRELKPTVIEDIIAMVALYRPGPMQFIESFIDRKHGRERIVFMHPLTENALKETYGIPVYQEQVMQVAKDMAGFTPGEADTLRKAMGKKIAKLMAELRVKFVEGSIKNQVKRETADAIFQQFEEFAAYGFNKSHAACYAMIAYQTAYLKAHYPEPFMAALLNSDSGNIDRITIEVEECRRMGLEVLPPDINESFTKFTVIKDKKQIRFGLVAIKGLGEEVVVHLIAQRTAHGPYQDLADFASRIQDKTFNRRSLESLIKSGALDRFGERNQLCFNMESILEYHRRVSQEASSGQVNLFSLSVEASRAPLMLRPAPAATERERLAWEKELLGLYISEHPFREYGECLRGLFIDIAMIGEETDKKNVRIGGMVTSAKRIMTKNNEAMMFAKLEDVTGDIEVVVFPRIFREKPEIWEAGKTLVVSGRYQEKDGEPKLLAESGYEITPDNVEEIKQYMSRAGLTSLPEVSSPIPEPSPPVEPLPSITLSLRAQMPESLLLKLRTILDQHPGRSRVFFAVEHPVKQKILTSYRITLDDVMSKELEGFLGPETVKVE